MVGSRSVVLAAALAGLVSASGCSSLIYHAAGQAGQPTAPQPELNVARTQLDRQFGTPTAVKPLPDGGQVVTYRYRQPDPEAAEMAQTSAGIHVGMWYITGGYGVLLSPVLELVLVPMAIYRAVRPPHGEVQFTVSADGLLMSWGPPASYGPDDVAVGAPSIGIIRRHCWTFGDESAYVDCVASRLAVWGIE
jgi:hypothetical protein